MHTASFSAKGPRSSNQDSVQIDHLNSETVVCAIADGVGGNNGGEVASQLATKSFLSSISQQQGLLAAVKFANAEINRVASEKLEYSNMATTFIGIQVNKKRLIGAHCGDSRLYLLRGKGIKQLTKDHTEVEKLQEEGLLTRTEAKSYPRRNILYSALGAGAAEEITIEEFDFDLVSGDVILLLTDGFYNSVSKKEFRDINLSSNDIEEFVEKAIQTLEVNGVDDNYSIIAVRID